MADYPAISGIDDPANVRVMLLQGKQQVNAPLTGLGLQPLDATLTALAALNSTAGLVVQTGADTFTKRTLTGTANEVTVTNGDGVAGAPTISLPAALTLTGKAVTGGTFVSTLLQGTATNDNAAAGNVGEVITSTIASGSAVTLVTTVAKNVTSISLTAGDWDVTGTVGFFPGATTSVTLMQQSISQTTNTHDTAPGAFQSRGSAAFVPGANATNNVLGATTQRISLAATTTIYLVASSAFTVAGQTAYGKIEARRAR